HTYTQPTILFYPPSLSFPPNCYLSTFTIMPNDCKIAEHMLMNELKELSKEYWVNAEVSLRFLIVLLSLCGFTTGSNNNLLI
ncbi:hypothetical protein L873DRAFT_1799799, partial [Choiromyces venosus 120613-1]